MKCNEPIIQRIGSLFNHELTNVPNSVEIAPGYETEVSNKSLQHRFYTSYSTDPRSEVMVTAQLHLSLNDVTRVRNTVKF